MRNKVLSIGGIYFDIPFKSSITPHEIPRKALSTLRTVRFMNTFTTPDTDPYGLKINFHRMAIRLEDSGCIWTNILRYTASSFVACSFYRGALHDYLLIFTSNGLRFAYIIEDKQEGV